MSRKLRDPACLPNGRDSSSHLRETDSSPGRRTRRVNIDVFLNSLSGRAGERGSAATPACPPPDGGADRPGAREPAGRLIIHGVDVWPRIAAALYQGVAVPGATAPGIGALDPGLNHLHRLELAGVTRGLGRAVERRVHLLAAFIELAMQHSGRPADLATLAGQLQIPAFVHVVRHAAACQRSDDVLWTCFRQLLGQGLSNPRSKPAIARIQRDCLVDDQVLADAVSRLATAPVAQPLAVQHFDTLLRRALAGTGPDRSVSTEGPLNNHWRR